MLVLSRKVYEESQPLETIQIKVHPSTHPTYLTLRLVRISHSSGSARIGIDAPPDVVEIVRGELVDKLIPEGGQW